MGELGLLGLSMPEAYGGQGGDYPCNLVLAEEMVQSLSGGLAMGVAVHTDMATPPILAFGTEEQKQAYLAPATKIEAARQMVYATAWRYMGGQYPVREISMAKLFAARMASEVADECLQIHGGAGYMREVGVERAWRDIRLNRIGAGTDEIMLEVIGRSYGL